MYKTQNICPFLCRVIAFPLYLYKLFVIIMMIINLFINFSIFTVKKKPVTCFSLSSLSFYNSIFQKVKVNVKIFLLFILWSFVACILRLRRHSKGSLKKEVKRKLTKGRKSSVSLYNYIIIKI